MDARTITDVDEACGLIAGLHARDPHRWSLDLSRARQTMPPEELLRRGLSVWDPGFLRHPDGSSREDDPIRLIILQPMTEASIERDYCAAGQLALFFFHDIDEGRPYELPRLTPAAES